jgi:AcrR family transcriptional regulator
MPRPPSNVDKLMIQAGLELLSETGISGLTVRQIVKRAKVNLGLFHYHFKSKDAFARRVLQAGYESFFSEFAAKVQQPGPPIKQLEQALLTYATFMRDNRMMVVALLKDSLEGFGPSAEFLGEKTTAHREIFIKLIKESQEDGSLQKSPVDRQFYFLMGATSMILLTATMMDKSLKPVAKAEEGSTERCSELYEDEALAERVRWAIKALSTDPAPRA